MLCLFSFDRIKSVLRAVRPAAVLVGLLGGAGLLAAQTPNSLQLPYISTVAGSPTGYVVTAGTTTQVIQNPICSLSIAPGAYSTSNHYTPGGQGDGCPPTQALLQQPTYTFIDADGNLYIGDAGGGTINSSASGDQSIREIYNGGTRQLNYLASVYNNTAKVSTSTIVPGYIYTFAVRLCFITRSPRRLAAVVTAQESPRRVARWTRWATSSVPKVARESASSLPRVA